MDFPDIDPQGGVRQPLSATEEKWHREQLRRSNDLIRVSNPTPNDFYVDWDHFIHRIPANSTADVPRYIATKYCRDMKDKLINEENEKRHDEHLKKRREEGVAEYLNKYEENQQTYSTQEYPRTNDYKKSVKIYDTLWVGVVKEFGLDQLYTSQDPRSGEVDATPDEVKILKSLDSRKVNIDTTTTFRPITEAHEAKKTTKKDLEKELTND